MGNKRHTTRAPWHDYRSRCIYMVTLSKRRDVPAFGRIEGNSHLPFGAPGACRIELSPLGRIVRNCIFDISLLEPSMKLLQYAMMPDHVHVLVLGKHSSPRTILGGWLCGASIRISSGVSVALLLRAMYAVRMAIFSCSTIRSRSRWWCTAPILRPNWNVNARSGFMLRPMAVCSCRLSSRRPKRLCGVRPRMPAPPFPHYQ